MGRSFSVFLFCFAMDPLFHYLNRIPHVLSVQAYVGDTTLVGDAQNTQWIQKVAQCYDDVRTAGFVVDSHSCYRSISKVVLWDSDPLQLAVHSCSKSGLLWWIVQPMLLPLLPYKRLCVEDTIRLSCEWPAGHLFLCRLSLRIRLRCILPSIWILSKDMKLFMVVTLILLAPFPQSSVRARVSLTLSLTFQWDLVLSPTLNWLAMACMRLRPLPLRLVWLSSEELPLIIKALGLCAPLLLHFVRVNPLPSRSSSNDSNLSVHPGSGHNWSGRDSPRSSMKFKSDPLAAVVFQDLLWLGLGQLALALLHLINGGLKLYVIGLSLQFDFWLWRILSGVYKHMIASSCADLRTETDPGVRMVCSDICK